KKKAGKVFSDEPIFIGGCGRSGTTLLLSIISAHPEVFACPRELGIFNKIHKGSDGEIVPDRIDRLYRCILTRKVEDTATRFCEKSPSNVNRFEHINDYYNGKVKFIHIIRDGRDACLSVHPTDKTKYWVEPKRWVTDVRAGLQHLNHPNVLTVFYEDLVSQYDQTISTICAFCDLTVTPEMQNWFEHTTVTKNSAYHNGVKKLHKGSVRKWEKPKNAKRVAEVLEYPGFIELLEGLGYNDSAGPHLKAYAEKISNKSK
ncbi:MAG TPA: sulfotransferase, partial [Cryomorphaceae bacterium]|nr:sulfotransferase [Cryomorphaceae bacterium]